MSDINQKEQNKKPQQDNGRDSSQGQNSQDNKPSVLEWVTGAFGLLLVIGAMGFTLYQALTDNVAPPEARIQITSTQQIPTGYVVNFTAWNPGNKTLAGLVVEAELKRGETIIESGQTTIDFLPSHSNRKGGFFFRQNPQAFTLDVYADGYQNP